MLTISVWDQIQITSAGVLLRINFDQSMFLYQTKAMLTLLCDELTKNLNKDLKESYD